MEKIIELSSHRFNNLNNYLKPLYTSIETCQETDQEKRVLFVRSSIAKFFKKVRLFREIKVEESVNRLKISTEQFLDMEEGRETLPNEIFFELTDFYSVQFQSECLLNTFEVFKNPSVKQARRDIALDLIKRFGIIPHGVDLRDLNKPRGKVISFSSK